MQIPVYETLRVDVQAAVAVFTLNRPDRANAMNEPMWFEFKAAMEWLDREPSLRVGVVIGAGDNFCGGIDVSMLMSVQGRVEDDCPGRRSEKLRELILAMQDTLSAAERCRKPVLAAVHGACVGAGLDLITACDLRYATSDARICLKEIDMGLVADVGVLQRLPSIIGHGRALEMAYTARTLDGDTALQYGLLSQVYPDVETLHREVMATAQLLASKSPLNMRGIKHNLLYVRDHTVDDSLRYIATWNAAMLMSADLQSAAMAYMTRQPAQYRD